MGEARYHVMRMVVNDYLDALDVNNPPEPHEIERDLLKNIDDEYAVNCCMMPTTKRWKPPESLPATVIADVIARINRVSRISCAGPDADKEHDMLAIYQKDGPDAGIYVEASDTVRKLTRKLNYAADERMCMEVLNKLKDISKRLVRNIDPDLIAVNNGVFNYKTKQLMDFNEEMVFLAKSYVDYNPNATNVIIHNDDDGTDWDVESWVADLTDDDEITNLIWELMSAIIRPNVPWDKSAWLYSESGANGKSSLCLLMRGLCGEKSYASIPLNAFGQEFMLEGLIRATAIITDENEVDMYIDKIAKLKAVITGEKLLINRKHKTPIAHTFTGLMVQCLNGFPRVKDRSESYHRRNLFIPFNKCFTGAERRYIKTYLKNKTVLEYVLFKVLNTNFYELSTPVKCAMLLDEYKLFNDPVRQFWAEFEEQFVWDLVPFSFMFDLYVNWSKRVNPSGAPLGKIKFTSDLFNGPLKTSNVWYCHDSKKRTKPSGRMDKPEPLIVEYDLTNWKNPTYRGTDPNKICKPPLAIKYSGILRDTAASHAIDEEEAKEA